MKKIFAVLSILPAVFILFSPNLVAAAPPEPDPICSASKPPEIPDDEWEAILTNAGCNTGSPSDEAFSTIRTVLNSVYFAVTIAAVGVIIFGGFRFSLSQGDPGKVKKAKDTIMYAIIGLIVVLSAFAITNFILGIL